MVRKRTGIAVRLLSIAMLLSIGCFVKVSWAAEPFKIGYCVSLTGVYATLGRDMVDGMNLYMDQIKHKAGGRDIEVVTRNIQSAVVTLAMDTAHKLVTNDKVDVLAGVVDSGAAYAVAKLVSEWKVPFVISNAGADDLTQRKASPFIVRTSFSSSSGSHPLGAWAYDQGFRKAVVMGPANPAGWEQVGGICRPFTKLGGSVIQEIWSPLGTQNFKPFMAKINPQADVVMVFFAGGDAIRFVRQYEEAGLKSKIPLIAKGDLVSEGLLPKEGSAADGIVSVLHWSLLADTPQNIRFKSAYQKKYGRPPSQFAEQGYVTGMVIAQALEKTKGQAKGTEFVKAMRSLELKAPRGIIRFDEYGAPIQNYYIRKVELVDGQRQNTILKVFPGLSQFWTWSPQEFMAMPTYMEMKGKWAAK